MAAGDRGGAGCSDGATTVAVGSGVCGGVVVVVVLAMAVVPLVAVFVFGKLLEYLSSVTLEFEVQTA